MQSINPNKSVFQTNKTDNLHQPKLRFKEFDGDWEVKKLGDISIFFDGKRKPIKESDRNKIKGKYPYYGASGIIDYVNDFIFEGEYILLGEDGANIITRSSPLAFLVQGKFWVNNHAHVLKAKGSNRFLSESLECIKYDKYNTGTAQPKLNANVCKSIILSIPTLPEQQKIASFLTAVDQKIELLNRKKEKLQQYKKGVMQQIFSQQIRFKQDNGKDFPDWEEKKLGEITEYYDGTHQTPKYVKSGIPFYSVEHVTANQFSKTKYISEEIFEKENRRVKLEKGDLLMTRIGDVGTVRLIDWDVKASFYVSLVLIKQNNTFDSSYLNQFIKSNYFQRELWKRIIHVAFPKKINLGEIGNCHVVLPIIQEQQKIANFLSAIDKKIESVNQQLEKAQQFKKGLLQQMLV